MAPGRACRQRGIFLGALWDMGAREGIPPAACPRGHAAGRVREVPAAERASRSSCRQRSWPALSWCLRRGSQSRRAIPQPRRTRSFPGWRGAMHSPARGSGVFHLGCCCIPWRHARRLLPVQRREAASVRVSRVGCPGQAPWPWPACSAPAGGNKLVVQFILPCREVVNCLVTPGWSSGRTFVTVSAAVPQGPWGSSCCRAPSCLPRRHSRTCVLRGSAFALALVVF